MENYFKFIDFFYFIRKVVKISQDKLPPMPEKSGFTFYNNFYPKPQIYLKDAKISEEIQNKLRILKQDYNDIVSQHRTHSLKRKDN